MSGIALKLGLMIVISGLVVALSGGAAMASSMKHVHVRDPEWMVGPTVDPGLTFSLWTLYGDLQQQSVMRLLPLPRQAWHDGIAPQQVPSSSLLNLRGLGSDTQPSLLLEPLPEFGF